jgi:hypothetical protein
MEFLSSEFNTTNNTYPVNLVLQSAESVSNGFNAAGSGDYKIANLPFNPTTGYHEYRIDFIPGNIIFYADGHELATMNTSAVPTSPGHLIVTNWSNGNSLWSSGPPPGDSVISVAYVKAYFNSSLEERQSNWQKRCQSITSPGATCQIPDQNAPPDPNIPSPSSNGSTAVPFFFSNQKNMTVNQTVYHKSKATLNASATIQQTILMLATLSLGVAILL